MTSETREPEATPSAHIGKMSAEFMDYLQSEADGERVIAALVVVWTPSATLWRSTAADDNGTARLALSLADAALTDEGESHA